MPDTPLTWDSALPGITWDAAQLLWDGPLPRLPRRRGPARQAAPPPPEPTPLTNTMPTFKYNPAPKTGGGFTTRPVIGPEIDVPALDAAVAAETGVLPEKCALVLKSYLQRLLAAAASGGQCTDIHKILRFRPTCGGSKPGPDDFHNADDINADVSLSYTIGAIRDWRTTLALESMGTVGRATPEVDAIFYPDTGQENRYVPGNGIEIVGDNLKLDRSDNVQGVFFQPATGAEVRATSYPLVDPKKLIVSVPATLSGPLTVRVAAFLNGSVRSFTYSIPITQ